MQCLQLAVLLLTLTSVTLSASPTLPQTGPCDAVGLSFGSYSASVRAHVDDNLNLELWNLDADSLVYSYRDPTYCGESFFEDCYRWGDNPFIASLGILDGGVNYRLAFEVHNLYRSSFGLDYVVDLTPVEPAVPERSTWSLVAVGLTLPSFQFWKSCRRPHRTNRWPIGTASTP